MYEIRQSIARLRLGESDRDIARSQRVGRKTVAGVRDRALAHGWLDAQGALPEDAALAPVFQAKGKRLTQVSRFKRLPIRCWFGTRKAFKPPRSIKRSNATTASAAVCRPCIGSCTRGHRPRLRRA